MLHDVETIAKVNAAKCDMLYRMLSALVLGFVVFGRTFGSVPELLVELPSCEEKSIRWNISFAAARNVKASPMTPKMLAHSFLTCHTY